jgi:hypothetical protein
MLRNICAVALLAGFSAASYPAAYPFENESNVPPAPLEATPSWTFDDADPGGYMYSFAFMFDITDEMFPFSYGTTGFFSHTNVVRSDLPPIEDISRWNCSAMGNELGPYSYFGVVSDVTICEEGECCKGSWGASALFDVSSPYAPYYDDISKVEDDGGCPEMFDEHVYCTFMAAYHPWGCTNQFVSTSEREFVYPCYDSIYNHYSSCTLYKNVGTMWRPSIEPEAYIAQSSAEQINAVNGLFWVPDRVCHPYSYFYPDTAKTSSSGSEGSVSETAESSADSESSAVGFAFAAIIAVAVAV